MTVSPHSAPGVPFTRARRHRGWLRFRHFLVLWVSRKCRVPRLLTMSAIDGGRVRSLASSAYQPQAQPGRPITIPETRLPCWSPSLHQWLQLHSIPPCVSLSSVAFVLCYATQRFLQLSRCFHIGSTFRECRLAFVPFGRSRLRSPVARVQRAITRENGGAHVLHAPRKFTMKRSYSFPSRLFPCTEKSG